MSLFTDASRYIPGGVNSPVRAFRCVGGEPVFIERRQGAHVVDAGWAQLYRLRRLVGSDDPRPRASGRHHGRSGTRGRSGCRSARRPQIETQLARKICELMPSIELVRMVSSGTEATMSAIRLARGFTGRSKIVKFEGCYHGHSDSLLVKAGSGALTLGVPTSPGVPPELAAHTITLAYNDIAQVQQTFNDMGREIACVIVEPIAGNMNCVLPVPGFLEALRSVCDQHGSGVDLR